MQSCFLSLQDGKLWLGEPLLRILLAAGLSAEALEQLPSGSISERLRVARQLLAITSSEAAMQVDVEVLLDVVLGINEARSCSTLPHHLRQKCVRTDLCSHHISPRQCGLPVGTTPP
jgi:hypothetical protein